MLYKLIYFQGQPTDIEIHQLEDMIVDECGCS